MKTKRTIIFTEAFLSVILFLSVGFSSCNSNEPQYVADYCMITYVNVTNNYCAQISVDGVPYQSVLWAGESEKHLLKDLKFPRDIKIEMHEIADETHYYTKVTSVISIESYYFSPECEYKVTIRENNASITNVPK